jgi:hypothetical protein
MKGETSRKKIINAERNKGKDEPGSRNKGLVVDKVNPERFKHIEMPMMEDVDDFTLSKEALETVDGEISSNIDSKKIKEFQRDDARKRVQQSRKENEENDDNEYAY